MNVRVSERVCVSRSWLWKCSCHERAGWHSAGRAKRKDIPPAVAAEKASRYHAFHSFFDRRSPLDQYSLIHILTVLLLNSTSPSPSDSPNSHLSNSLFTSIQREAHVPLRFSQTANPKSSPFRHCPRSSLGSVSPFPLQPIVAFPARMQ